ncbi:MAG: hypothetical protein CL748_06975, partial [Chloroflexi bacterium]|nr:hypothetical protein [Chloroflexota bacterium]
MRAIGFYIQNLEDNLNFNFPFDRLTSQNEIHEYSQTHKHNIVSWYKVQSSNSQTEIYDNYRRLISEFSKPDAKLALVLIPDSFHIASDIETLARRIIHILSLGADIRCTNPEYPDPFQNALKYLSFSNRENFSNSKKGKTIIQKAYRGEILGKIPYGYKSSNDTIIIDDNESKIVRMIFEWYSEFSYGLRVISRLLNQKGYRTKSGNIWTPLSIRNILTNRTYIGTYNRYGVRITSNHEPIVSIDIFNKVSYILSSRNISKKKYIKSSFLLSKKIKCEICGNGLSGITRKRTWQLKNKKSITKIYRYYRCSARIQIINEQSKFHSLIDADNLEKEVLSIISHWDDDLISKIAPISLSTYSDNINDAYLDFTRAFQNYATGREKINFLQDSINTLDKIRSRKKISTSETPRIIYDNIFTNDSEKTKKSLNQLVSKIILKNN